MEIAFINLNFPYKRITSTLFPELLLCLQLLKNNQLEIIPMPKNRTLGLRILHVYRNTKPQFWLSKLSHESGGKAGLRIRH